MIDCHLIRDTTMQWEFNFSRLAQEWELEALVLSFDLLYLIKPINYAFNMMRWHPNHSFHGKVRGRLRFPLGWLSLLEDFNTK